MAERIVNLLEIVYIGDRDCERQVVPSGSRTLTFKELIESAAILYSRQRIDQRVALGAGKRFQ